MKVACVVSGGKDSVYASFLAEMYGFEVDCWITFVPENKESYLLHTVNLDFVRVQAKKSGVRHLSFKVSGKKNREWIEIAKVLERVDVDAILVGAVRSDYQRHFFELISERSGKILYAPLWHKNEEKLIREIVESGFEFVVTFGSIDIEEFVGRVVRKDNLDIFVEKLKETGASIVGEGGEYESFVVRTPFWKINVRGRKVKEGTSCYFIIESAE